MADEMDFMGDDQISDRALPEGARKPAAPAPPELKTVVMRTVARQQPFFDLIAQFHQLFEEIPQMTTREADAKVQEMFSTFLEACEVVGISKMSIPPLKECCGKRRQWKDEEKPGGLRLGDRLAWLFSKLGFKPCAGCKKRQAALNNLFRRKGSP